MKWNVEKSVKEINELLKISKFDNEVRLLNTIKKVIEAGIEEEPTVNYKSGSFQAQRQKDREAIVKIMSELKAFFKNNYEPFIDQAITAINKHYEK